MTTKTKLKRIRVMEDSLAASNSTSRATVCRLLKNTGRKPRSVFNNLRLENEGKS